MNFYMTKPKIFLAFFVGGFLTFSMEVHGSASVLDRAIACVHSVVCVRCMFNPEAHANEFAQAIDQEDTRKMRWLCIRRDIDPNMVLKGEAPIMRAVRLQKISSIETLLDLEAHPDSQYQFAGYPCPSALIAACLPAGNSPDNVLRIVQLLLEKGAQPQLGAYLATEAEMKEILKRENERRKKNSESLHQEQFQLAEPFKNPRTALDFAKLNGYKGAEDLLRTKMQEIEKSKNGEHHG